MSTIQKINYHAWLMWLIVALFYGFEFIHRVAPASMVGELIQEFNISNTAVGNISAYYYYAYALLQIPVGMMFDRLSVKKLLITAAIILGIGSFGFASTGDATVAKLTRALVGAGSAFAFIGCLKIGTEWFPNSMFALLVGLTNLLGLLGAILGGKPFAAAMEYTSWRNLMQYSGYISLGFAVLFWLVLKDKKHSSKDKQDNLNRTEITWKPYIFNTHILKVSILGMLMVAPIAAFSELWGVKYLMGRIGIGKNEAAAINSLTFVGIALGGPFFGYLKQYFSYRKILVVNAALAFLSMLAILYINPPVIEVFQLSMFFMGFTTSSMLLCFALNSSLVPFYMQGYIIGFTNTLIMMGGVIFQPLIGFLLDFQKSQLPEYFDDVYLQHALIILPLCQILAIIIAYNIKSKN